METLMDSKLDYMSMVVANTVSKKLMGLIIKMMKGKSDTDESESGTDEVTITQDSPHKERKIQGKQRPMEEKAVEDRMEINTCSTVSVNKGSDTRSNTTDSNHDKATVESMDIK